MVALIFLRIYRGKRLCGKPNIFWCILGMLDALWAWTQVETNKQDWWSVSQYFLFSLFHVVIIVTNWSAFLSNKEHMYSLVKPSRSGSIYGSLNTYLGYKYLQMLYCSFYVYYKQIAAVKENIEAHSNKWYILNVGLVLPSKIINGLRGHP